MFWRNEDDPGVVAQRRPTVDVVVPVFNEERALPGCVEVLSRYLAERIPLDATITVVDNGGTDDTLRVANALAARTPACGSSTSTRRDAGSHCARPWSRSEADIVAYMDVDLSTGLDALLPLVAPLISGHSDVAIGSRLAPGARIRSGCREDTTAEKVQIGAGEHLALEHLQPVDVTLHQS